MEKYIKILDYYLRECTKIERKYFFKEVNIFKKNPTLLNISSNTLFQTFYLFYKEVKNIDLFLQELNRLEVRFRELDENIDSTWSYEYNKKKYHLTINVYNNNMSENQDILYHIAQNLITDKKVNRFFGRNKRGIINLKGYSQLIGWSSVTNNIPVTNSSWNQTDLYGEVMRNVKSVYDNKDSNSIVTEFSHYNVHCIKTGIRSRRQSIPFESYVI